MKQRLFTFVTIGLLIASASLAQTAPGEPDLSAVRVRLGPLLVNPAVALTNAGIDTNVFNEPDIDQPKSDFTMTMTPQAQAWLRMGRTWATGSIKEDFVWFKKYDTERSVNHNYTAGWLAPLTRIAVSANGAWLHTRERPGFEIDVRTQRSETTYGGRFELRALSKTLIGVHGQRQIVAYDQDSTFLGTSLRDQLNRTSTTGAVTLRYELTPLTSVTIDASRVQDRFEFSPLRDADSTVASVNLRFDPAALLNGSAQVGYRKFEPLVPGVPSFDGTTAAVDLSYVAGGSTKMGLRVLRDVEYSYDVNQPYYLITGINASIAQQIFGPVDVTGRVGAQRLSYRDREDVLVILTDRTDHIRSYGGGVGYHMGGDLRIGFEVDQSRRESEIVRRRYHGLRYGVSVTYGGPR